MVLGLAGEMGAGAVASAVSWPDLSQCINPRSCNIFDPTGLWRLAQFANLVGVVVAGIGFVLYGMAMMRSRLLPRGNGLPLLLGVASTLWLLIVFAAVVIVPATDGEGTIRIDAVIALGSVLETILIILFGRTLLQASPVVALP